MARTPNGRRHEINILIGVAPGLANIQAICICQELKAPMRFDRGRAEEDGRQHLLDFAVKGAPSHKGNR